MEEKKETAETPKEEVAVVKAKRGPKPKKPATEQPPPEQSGAAEETPAPKERKRAVRKTTKSTEEKSAENKNAETAEKAAPESQNHTESQNNTEAKSQSEQQKRAGKLNQDDSQGQTEPPRQRSPRGQTELQKQRNSQEQADQQKQSNSQEQTEHQRQSNSQEQTEHQRQSNSQEQTEHQRQSNSQEQTEHQRQSNSQEQTNQQRQRNSRGQTEQQRQNNSQEQNGQQRQSNSQEQNEQQRQSNSQEQNEQQRQSNSQEKTEQQSRPEQQNQNYGHQNHEQSNQEHQNSHSSHSSYDDNREYRYNKRNKGRHNNQHQQRKNFPEKSRPARTRYLDLLKENEESIRKTAHDYQISRTSSMTFPEVTFEVFKNVVESEGGGISACRGILEILADGYGFLRTQMCAIESTDVYVSNAQIKKLGLRTGDYVVGQTRPPKDNESYQALLRVECINDTEPERSRRLPSFDNLTPLYPNQRFNLHVEDNDPSVRIVDLVTPIGKGQRGLIVAPPKAGKTTLLKQIANALTSNHPDIVLFVLLIDERPEEVTDMTRSVEGEVFASTFDQQLNNHIRVSEMVLERAKRLVEQGKDVVILLDSITRLARAYNIAVPSTGQTLSGGVNPLALYKPKKFFGSARKIEFGGSLTILATALIDTGSKMDDVIFEEFKGTGNMELHLDRTLFNKRIFPSINLSKSSTRREELLVPPEALKGMTILRRVFESVSAQEAIELLKKQVKQSRDNELLLSTLLRSADMKNI
jgi:transcription termination factor Rho